MNPNEQSQALQRLKTALSERAFKTDREHRMVSTSGDPVVWFLDFRSILLESGVLDDTASLMWERLKHLQPFQVGGLETSAIALVAAIVMTARREKVELNGFYIRKSRKKDGMQRTIEGTLDTNDVVLVDDGINSGRSIVRQIELLRRIGKKVRAICVLVRFRDRSFYRFFEEQGIEVISLLTLDDIPETGGISSYGTTSASESLTAPKSSFTVQWRFESNDPVFFHVLPKSAPCIDADHVYFGADNGTFWALNKTDGSVAWKYKTLFGTAGGKRIFSSPAVADTTVYFGAYDGNFYALDTLNGSVRWIYREADWIGSSPCVAPDLGVVFIGLEFGLWNKQGGIAALDMKTGEKRWWYQDNSLTHSSPAYSKRHALVVVGSSSGTVHAFDARTGKHRWDVKTNGAVRAGFAFDEKRGYVCFGSEDGFIYAVSVRDGAIVHKIESLEPLYSTPLVAGDRLYMGGLDKRMLCIDLGSGSVVWQSWTHARIFSSPTLIGDAIFFGSNDGRLYKLDAMTGKEIAYFQATERIVNKIAYDPETKRIFLPTYANEIYCLTENT